MICPYLLPHRPFHLGVQPMKPKYTAACLAIAVVAAMALSCRGRGENQRTTRATLELSDGSRLVGVPIVESLPATLSFAETSDPAEWSYGSANSVAVTAQLC